MKFETKNIISENLGMSVQQIQTSSWNDIEKTIIKPFFRSGFRPSTHFQITGNIHMEQGKYMDTTFIDLYNMFDSMRYKITCLIKNFKNK